MNMAVKTQNPTVLLRRPLPPKVLSPLPDSCRQKLNRDLPSCTEEIRRKKHQLTLSSTGKVAITCRIKNEQQVTDLETDLLQQPCKPNGPDPLPARTPRRVRENPYEIAVDRRFARSPMFSLDDFLRKWEESTDREVTKPTMGDISGNESHKTGRAYELPRQEEIHKQIFDANSAELPQLLSRKPQRQIVIELAAAILSNEGEKLDQKITEILQQVEAPTFRQPTRFLRGLHARGPGPVPDSGSASSALQEWSEFSSARVSGPPEIAYIVSRNVGQKQTESVPRLVTGDGRTRRAIMSKGETYPQGEVLLSRSPTTYFQGLGRCSSPFENDKSEHGTMLTAAEFVVLETIVKCYTTLDLKAHFIDQLPNIQPIRSQLTAVNLSFNNFWAFPTEIFSLENLVSLNLRNNPLKEIPPEIGQLSQLQVFTAPFCLISSLSLSLFSLKHLKVLDLAYNRLSFIPNEIAQLRSLIEFSVEGNELGAFPTGILRLKLKYLRMTNNLTHALFWREATGNQPQRLFHMAAQIVVANSIVTTALPEGIRMQLLKRCAKTRKKPASNTRPQTCDCCDGPVFGQGVRIIRPVRDMFGVKHLPLFFVVCSQTCRLAFKKDQQAINNWLDKNCPTLSLDEHSKL